MDLKKWLLGLGGGVMLLAALLAGMYVYNRQSPGNTLPAVPAAAPGRGLAVATFAGGCFWCMEAPFDKLPGVKSSTSGYTGGQTRAPSYEQVSSGATGHAEAVRLVFDPKLVSYERLLEVFWRQINPTTPDRQFVDLGSQYRTAIFYHSEAQKRLAIASRNALEKANRFGAPIVTEIQPAGDFWPAEAYHQDYYLHNAAKYQFYRWNSGRDQYLEKIWGQSMP